MIKSQKDIDEIISTFKEICKLAITNQKGKANNIHIAANYSVEL